MKRICHVVQSYYRRDPRVRREAEALAAAGYEVDVIALKERGQKWTEVINGVRVFRVPITRRRATVWRYLIEYVTFFVIVAFLLTIRLYRRYDLIHVNNMPDFLVYSTVLPKWFGSKILLDVHDPMAEVFMSKYQIDSNSIIIKLLRWQEKISLRFCHHILTVSDVMKERIQRAAGYTPVSVVLNVPDEALFGKGTPGSRPADMDDEFVLLYTGTMSSRYGLQTAIEAVDDLKGEIPEIRLRLVGEGDDLPYLREMVKSRGLEDRVEFHPPVHLNLIPDIIRSSDVGISPHHDDGFMSLYFSTKVAEFVNLGLPTIVSRTRTMECYFEDGMVRYCDAGDTESFTEAIRELYHNPELRAGMSEKGLEFAKKFSWGVEKEKYLDVVGRLVGDKSRCTQPKGRVLILVENLPVPFDRRVWAESLALTEAGYKVSVICPTGPNEPLLDTIDGVSIYRYPAPTEAAGAMGYLWEFTYSMLASFRLSLKVLKREGFDVFHACNPPDTFFVLGKYYQRFYKKPFVFDHHDISPELYSYRFGKSEKSLVCRVLLWLERCTFNAADVVMSVNESVKGLATGRGAKDPSRVFVVRNAPDLRRFGPKPPDMELKKGRKYLVAYVGVMAAQDGLEYLLNAVNRVVNERGRQDITFALIGSGDKLDSLKQMAKDMKIEDYVYFTGRIRDDNLLTTYLSTADVCVAPDPKNELNDKCSLIKITEYMAMGKPVVAFDLTESRYTAQDAAIYAVPNDTGDFGDKIIELIDDPQRREEMGQVGLQRVRDYISWEHSKKKLLEAYELALTGQISPAGEEQDKETAVVGMR